MIALPPGVRVWLAGGATDMRKGMNGLALMVQEGLKRDPHVGDLFVFPRPGRAAGEAALARRGRHVALREAARPWPVHLAAPADGAVAVSAAQLGYLLDGIDWRNPRHTWRPSAAG